MLFAELIALTGLSCGWKQLVCWIRSPLGFRGLGQSRQREEAAGALPGDMSRVTQ